MPEFAAIIAIAVVLFVAHTDAYCQTACLSDMQCKGFVSVNQLYICLQGCCSSPNSVIADVRPTGDCWQHNIEGFNTSAANAYPWLGLVVQTNGTRCLFFVAPLVAPNWLATDNLAYTNVNDPTFTTTVYFYIDDPVKRQIYNVTDSEKGRSDIVFLRIQYIGIGVPLAIAPVAVQCNTVNPPQLTMLYWIPLNENNLSRTFTSRQVDVLSNADCDAALLAFGDNARTSAAYLCPDYGTDPMDAGTSAFIVDAASGNLQLVGIIGVNRGANPIERVSSRVADFQSVTGAVCA